MAVHIAKSKHPYRAGVPGGSVVFRVTGRIDVVGSSSARDSFLISIIDRPKVRDRKLAKFDAK